MPPANPALLLSTLKSPSLTLSTAPYTHPSAGEIVIKTHAVALNPADSGIQRLGIIISAEDGYPSILGCDVAGEVVELPPTSSSTATDAKHDWLKYFKLGDRVIAQTGPMHPKPSMAVDFTTQDPELEKQWSGKKIYANSGFQSYVVLDGPLIVKIPDHISYEDAVVLPLGITTAASCLFPPTMLNLDFPPFEILATKTKRKILLVWGASSSVGSCGVQLAVHAGYTVVAICSAKNHAMVRSLGAVQCFDQSSSTIVDDVASYIQTSESTAGAEIEVVGAYDAISTAATLPHLCKVLSTLASGGVKTRKFIASVFPGAEQHAVHGVEIIVNLTQVMEQFYETAGRIRVWLEQALSDGRVKCMPEKEVLGHGFEVIQGGLDNLAQGKVSGAKLVATI